MPKGTLSPIKPSKQLTTNTEPTTNDVNHYLVVKDNNNSGQSVAFTTTNIKINPNYTGEVILLNGAHITTPGADGVDFTGTLYDTISSLNSRISSLESGPHGPGGK